tara:strand:- start:777 stop:1226 length:450 start_codon:yes stop_codon:yes gene_type:complete
MVIRKIYISGDHAGFELKNKVKSWLAKKYEVKDFGPLAYDKDDDYPDFVIPMARAVSKDRVRGIIIAGSGQGEAIAVNKVKGIKAGLYHGGSTRIVKSGRGHDDLNILCMGERFVSEVEAKKAIDIFLKTKFDGGRHSRRLKKIAKEER